MPKGEETSSALVITDARITKTNKLASLQKKAAKQLTLIARNEKENVTRRLFIGLALTIIKESLDRGEWMPWLESQVAAGTSMRQLHYMMAAARVWIEKSGIGTAEVAALPGGNFSLTVKDGPAKKLAKAAIEFVGDRTWGELLAEEEIKDGAPSLGGARPRTTTKSKAQSAEQLYLFARDEIGGAIETVERVFVKENLLQHLDKHPEEIAGVVESLRRVADEVEKAAKPMMKK